MTRRPAHVFPFQAIVGQEQLKTALLLNAIDPRVGGVLIRGEKGTAKSTAVRALAAVLPEMRVVDGCRYSCDPGDPGSWCDECRERRESKRLEGGMRRPRIVDLPVSATEDRLVGTLDFERALKKGERSFHPGLLAEANRGIVYVDEVNLLDDHLVDTLLDAAAMGVNVVEREGVSYAHPARFVLVGTMNPEEGDLRPQLLDRFGLCVEVQAVRVADHRVEIMRRRRAFEENASAFLKEWEDRESQLRERVDSAQRRAASVAVSDESLYAIADLCIRAEVDGHRADHVMARAAAAYAAFEGRDEVTLADIARVAPLVLAHRLRRTPFEDVRADTESLRDALVRSVGEAGESGSGSSSEAGPGQGQASIFETIAPKTGDAESAPSVEVGLQADMDRARRSMSGRRQQTVSDDGRGRYRRAELPRGAVGASDVALDATIRAAASGSSPGQGDMAVNIRGKDIRAKVRTRKVGATIVFCVDGSGSMGASARIEAAKAAVLDLLVDAYQRRDRVAVVSFRGEDAETVLAPTSSVELASLKLRELPTGGATPLAAGLLKSLDVIAAEQRREPDSVPWLILVTDGRANVGLGGGLGSEDARRAAGKVRECGINAVVIDTAETPGMPGAARELARHAGAEYVRLGSVDGVSVASAVRKRVAGKRSA